MEPTKYVMDTVMAIATSFAKRGIEITLDKAKEIIEGICQKNPALRGQIDIDCLLYTSPSPRDGLLSRMPSSA